MLHHPPRGISLSNIGRGRNQFEFLTSLPGHRDEVICHHYLNGDFPSTSPQEALFQRIITLITKCSSQHLIFERANQTNTIQEPPSFDIFPTSEVLMCHKRNPFLQFLWSKVTKTDIYRSLVEQFYLILNLLVRYDIFLQQFLYIGPRDKSLHQ